MKKWIPLFLTVAVFATLLVAVSADGTTIVSGTSVTVYGPLASYAEPGDPAWGTGSFAVPTWVDQKWPSIPGATWISTSYYIGDDGGSISDSSWRWFTEGVDLCPSEYASGVQGTITATADNAEEVYVNGVLVGSYGEVQGDFIDEWEWETLNDYDFYLPDGTSEAKLDFIVRNYDGLDYATGNPTGLIFKATITYECGPIPVDIDIKPGGYPNCFNNDGHGVIPVAMLGSETFDVSQIDADTVSLDGLTVAARGKASKLLAAYEDVNSDGFMDLVVKIEDVDGTFAQGSGTAMLTGNLLPEFGGTPFQGTDEICVTQ